MTIHCFCACHISTTTQFIIHNSPFIITAKHPQNQKSQQEYCFFICHKIPNNCFSGKAVATSITSTTAHLLITLNSQRHSGTSFSTKAIKNIPHTNKKKYTCFELLPQTLGMIMHCFCECRPSLTTSIAAIKDANKVLVCTHKIKMPARVLFFICHKIPSYCICEKADAMHVHNTTLISFKYSR